ncbi:MAG TPA: hypothetical protein P5326_01210 [Candidatus Contendobacter sp.]|nr:hypothetical protein [Candidatus Contendobacter sp.]HRZ22640.1 hypothetical protein [Candidatus Contendobacter sp.]
MSTLTPELRNQLRQELPGWLREDAEFRQWILNITRGEFADRIETESRFDRLDRKIGALVARPID